MFWCDQYHITIANMNANVKKIQQFKSNFTASTILKFIHSLFKYKFWKYTDETLATGLCQLNLLITLDPPPPNKKAIHIFEQRQGYVKVC